MTDAHIVLTHGHLDTLETLSQALHHQGLTVATHSSWTALQAWLTVRPASVLAIDLDLPDGQGLEMVRELRARYPQLGIIALSEDGSLNARIDGLSSGADAYLVQPVDARELHLTVRTLLRRLPLAVGECPPGWALNPRTLTLTAPNGAHIALTHNETRVLNAAARAEGALVSRRCLIEALGANYWDYDERRLEALISRLRRKLPGLSVRGIKGQGYVFDPVRLDGPQQASRVAEHVN